MIAQVIKTLKQQPNLQQVLVSYKDNYYVVSHSTRMKEPETLIFKSDSEGNTSDWAEVGGARYCGLNEVIESMEDYMYENRGW